MKVLLKDSATREKDLMNEREEMERKISILERFPPGAKLTDSEVHLFCIYTVYCSVQV